ncbi:MAG: hypothetical protein AB7E61_07740 [Acholeplasmataceae bacterium]
MKKLSVILSLFLVGIILGFAFNPSFNVFAKNSEIPNTDVALSSGATTSTDTTDDPVLPTDPTTPEITVVDDQTILDALQLVDLYFSSDVLTISNETSDLPDYQQLLNVSYINVLGEESTFQVYYNLIEGTEITLDNLAVVTDVEALVVLNEASYVSLGTLHVLDDCQKLDLVVTVDETTSYIVEIEQNLNQLEFEFATIQNNVVIENLKIKLKTIDTHISYFLNYETDSSTLKLRYDVDSTLAYTYRLDYLLITLDTIVSRFNVAWNVVVDELTSEVSYDFVTLSNAGHYDGDHGQGHKDENDHHDEGREHDGHDDHHGEKGHR